MIRIRFWFLMPILFVAVVAALWKLRASTPAVPSASSRAGRPPRIDPDYSGCSIPPNIAPLNFTIKEPGERYVVRVFSQRGESFLVGGRSPQIIIPPDEWRLLLEANRGNDLKFDVYAVNKSGRWQQFDTVVNSIAPEAIDSHVVYRLLKPVHNLFANMGTFQRDLGTYRETPILVSKYETSDRCVNCHTFAVNKPDRMILHMRGRDGVAMLLGQNGHVTKIDTRTGLHPSPASYPAWHPNGELIAFSFNKLDQFHHWVGNSRDVFDYHSDLGLYRVESNCVMSLPTISDPKRLETFPAWSPDGKYLYFSSAKKTWDSENAKERIIPPDYHEVRYDLMRIAYDANAGTGGELEVVLSAEETGMSVLEPRVSPDGRFLLFCMADYGSFPVYRNGSDLYMMDLQSREYWALQVNSNASDTWHAWSSNSRWIAFASKRRDGLFGRIYFAYVDTGGKTHKQFLLPQRDPTFYDSCLNNYNAPELITGPVSIPQQEFLRAIYASEAKQATLCPDSTVGSRRQEAAPGTTQPGETGYFQ